MNSNQILLWVFFVALVFFGYTEGSCRFYEEELGVNQTWPSCKALCTQKNGTCLVWAHNNETNRCVGWMFEAESERQENATYYYKGTGFPGIGLTGGAVEEKHGEDDDASISGSPQSSNIYGEKNDLEENDIDSTVETKYTASYNTSSPGEEADIRKDDDRGTTRSLKGGHSDVEDDNSDYYASFYITPTQNEGGERDHDDEGSSDYTSYGGMGYDYITSGGTEESDGYDYVESTAEDYSAPFDITPTDNEGGERDHDDEGSLVSPEYDDFHFELHGGIYGGDVVSDDDDIGTSNSASSDIPSDKSISPFVSEEGDPEMPAVLERYISIPRGPLYDQCEIIVVPRFTIPVNSVNNAMSGCFFQKVELGNPSTKENCIAVCQNLHSSVHATCIAWMWRAEEKDCVGLVLTSDSNYSFCGLL